MMDQAFSSSNTLYNEHEYENYNFGTAIDNLWHQYQIQQTNLQQYQPKPQPELQPQPQVYPSEMYQNRVALGPAPNVDYNMASMFDAGGAQYGQQYGQPYVMQNMMGPASLAPPPTNYFPQSGMVMCPPSDFLIPPQPYGGSLVQRTKRKAVGGDGATREKRTRQRRIRPEHDPEFQKVIKNGKVMYKCLKRRCVDICLQASSVHEHKGTNKHQERSNHLLCLACGHYLSRMDGLKRHAKSGQCAKNQKKSNMSSSTFMALPPVTEFQGPFASKVKAPETQQSPPSFGPNSSSGPAAQPIIQAPRLSSVTQNATPFPVFAQGTLSLHDALLSVQVPHEPRSMPHYPSGVPPMPITAQDFSIFAEGEDDADLFGSPVMGS